MWDSDACMKTVNDVTSGLKNLKWKKDKLQALKDNIQIRYRGLVGMIGRPIGLTEGCNCQFQN